MTVPARRFRIEMGQGLTAVSGEMAAGQYQEIIRALAEIRGLLGTTEQVSHEIVEDYRGRVEEARALRAELESIQQAITTTKLELAALHVGPGGRDIHRVTDELDAVVQGTEEATEQVLQAAETIDGSAADLVAHLKNQRDVDLVNDIRDQAVRIFEACNFQDLTGQRITKVVNTLRFIEERVGRMISLWGDLEAFVAPGAGAEDGTVMHGPALSTDIGVASQDDIDALFN